MYAVIGDLVGSRRLADRAGAQRAVAAVLAEVAERVPGRQPIGPTVGDEFQGGYDTLGEATAVALLVRLALLPDVDVRCGIGVGETTVYDDRRTPLLQDGSAWWAARAAMEWMAAPRRAGVRTWVVAADARPGSGAEAAPDAGAVAVANAHLLCRDALVDRLSDRGRRMLRLALLGASQQRIAELEGVSKSAVSQQFARGISAVRDAQALLESEGVVTGP